MIKNKTFPTHVNLGWAGIKENISGLKTSKLTFDYALKLKVS